MLSILNHLSKNKKQLNNFFQYKSFNTYLHSNINLFSSSKQKLNYEIKQFLQKISHKNNLPSLQQSILYHYNSWINQKQKRSDTCIKNKYFITQDKKTLEIAQKIIQKKKMPIDMFSNPCQRLKLDQMFQQNQSIEVIIKRISKSSQEYQKYKEYRKLIKEYKQKETIVGVGGPASNDQILLASIIPSIRNNYNIHYYTRSYMQSSVFHSTWQGNARRAPALNTKHSITGRSLLKIILKRMIFGQTLKEITKLNYPTFDIHIPNLRTAYAYLNIQINGIIQSLKRQIRPQQLNEFDICRMDALASRQIQRILEKQLGKTINGKYFLNYLSQQTKKKCMNIDLLGDKVSYNGILKDINEYTKLKGLENLQISQRELKEYFPSAFKNKNQLFGGFRWIGDFSNNVDLYYVMKEKAVSLGVKWIQDKTVKQIFVTEDDLSKKSIKVCGIKFEDGQFIPVDKIHLSLGYKAIYRYENGQQCLNSFSVPATGVSCNIILKRNQAINKIIQQSGQFDISFNSTHLSVIDYDDQYLLLRGAIGANVGSQAYCSQHFLNLITTCKTIFGEAMIGVVSIFGCIRAVNFKNTSQFAKICDGLIISYGKGGTGSKKRSSQGYKVLKYLGYQSQLQEYFKNKKEQKINQMVEQICKLFKKTGFFYDKSKQTFNTLNFDK